jgi:hypothetical protein
MRLDHTEQRHTALAAVYADQVRFHSAPATVPRYEWCESAHKPMTEETRRVLQELWSADLVEVETYRLFAQRGHRVTVTTQGYLQLMAWGTAPADTEAPLLATSNRG